MALIDSGGVQFAPMVPKISYGALAGVKPLSFGQNPLKFKPAAPRASTGQERQYIAEGISKAFDAIGAGITARYRRQDAATEQAQRQEQFERQQTAKEADDEKRRENEKIRAEAEKLRASAAEIKERSNAVRATPPEESVMDEDSNVAPADSDLQSFGQESTSGLFNDEAAYNPEKVVESQNAALQDLAPLASAQTQPEPAFTLSGVSGPGPVMSLSVAPLSVAPVAAVPVAAPALAPAPAPAPAVRMTLAEQKAAAEQEAEILKGSGVFGNLPLPEISTPAPAPKKEELPKLGTESGEKDQSLVDAVKNVPALGELGEPLLRTDDSSLKGALSKPPATQEVDQKDMRYQFGSRPDLANRQALLFNKKYPYANVQAKVKEPSKSVPYWHVEYDDVSKERRTEFRTIEEHAATLGLKQQRLDLSREAKVQAMANNYEKHPTSKLMDVRKDAMQRMLVAVQEDKHARENNDAASLGLIHQEMMDLFAQFASGKAPTEAQFSETKHAFAGLSGFQNIAKKVQFWKSGAKLDERDVRTMQDLMLNTYNTSADQINSQLTTIDSILKSENPNISPMKMPVKYPLLKTKEFLKERLEGKDPEEALTEYAKLRGEYFDEVTGQFKKDMPQEKRAKFLKLKPIAEDYAALKNNNFIPPNLNELKHPKKEMFGQYTYFKVPGFHASYFSAPPASSLPMGGNWQGQGE